MLEAPLGADSARGVVNLARLRFAGIAIWRSRRRYRRYRRIDGDCRSHWYAGRRSTLCRHSRCGNRRSSVKRSSRLLIIGGLSLVAFGMFYGLYYAAFVEHQTLDQMGGSLAQTFVHAAERNSDQSKAALDAYGATKYDYVRQVDAHSHWIGF